jgi:hypothetical protein
MAVARLTVRCPLRANDGSIRYVQISSEVLWREE